MQKNDSLPYTFKSTNRFCFGRLALRNPQECFCVGEEFVKRFNFKNPLYKLSLFTNVLLRISQS